MYNPPVTCRSFSPLRLNSRQTVGPAEADVGVLVVTCGSCVIIRESCRGWDLVLDAKDSGATPVLVEARRAPIAPTPTTMTSHWAPHCSVTNVAGRPMYRAVRCASCCTPAMSVPRFAETYRPNESEPPVRARWEATTRSTLTPAGRAVGMRRDAYAVLIPRTSGGGAPRPRTEQHDRRHAGPCTSHDGLRDA